MKRNSGRHAATQFLLSGHLGLPESTTTLRPQELPGNEGISLFGITVGSQLALREQSQRKPFRHDRQGAVTDDAAACIGQTAQFTVFIYAVLSMSFSTARAAAIPYPSAQISFCVFPAVISVLQFAKSTSLKNGLSAPRCR